jgi:putative transposase
MRPTREHATNNGQTYMVTSSRWERRSLFHVDRWAELFIKTLYQYRGEMYFLHEFVLMPDHFHLLITPNVTLERAVQYVKGGFSFRAKKELGSNMEVWQKGFQDHRIRDAFDDAIHRGYIHQNPVRRGLCNEHHEYQWSSAHAGYELDAAPQGLKPDCVHERFGAPEGASFQNKVDSPPSLNASDDLIGAVKAAPFQSIKS